MLKLFNQISPFILQPQIKIKFVNEQIKYLIIYLAMRIEMKGVFPLASVLNVS